MLKSEWTDNSQELTADETSQVGGGSVYSFPGLYTAVLTTDPVYLAWLERGVHGLPPLTPTPTPTPAPVPVPRDKGRHRY